MTPARRRQSTVTTTPAGGESVILHHVRRPNCRARPPPLGAGGIRGPGRSARRPRPSRAWRRPWNPRSRRCGGCPKQAIPWPHGIGNPGQQRRLGADPTRSAATSMARSATAWGSVIVTARTCANVAMPGLPGARRALRRTDRPPGPGPARAPGRRTQSGELDAQGSYWSRPPIMRSLSRRSRGPRSRRSRVPLSADHDPKVMIGAFRDAHIMILGNIEVGRPQSAGHVHSGSHDGRVMGRHRSSIARCLSADHEAGRRGQDDVVTTPSVGSGVTEGQLKTLCRDRRWLRLNEGVYLVDADLDDGEPPVGR